MQGPFTSIDNGDNDDNDGDASDNLSLNNIIDQNLLHYLSFVSCFSSLFIWYLLMTIIMAIIINNKSTCI